MVSLGVALAIGLATEPDEPVDPLDWAKAVPTPAARVIVSARARVPLIFRMLVPPRVYGSACVSLGTPRPGSTAAPARSRAGVSAASYGGWRSTRRGPRDGPYGRPGRSRAPPGSAGRWNGKGGEAW